MNALWSLDIYKWPLFNILAFWGVVDTYWKFCSRKCFISSNNLVHFWWDLTNHLSKIDQFVMFCKHLILDRHWKYNGLSEVQTGIVYKGRIKRKFMTNSFHKSRFIFDIFVIYYYKLFFKGNVVQLSTMIGELN